MISTNDIGETRCETIQVISDDSYITVTDLAGNISEIVSANPKIETKLKSRTYIRYKKGHNIWTDDSLIKLQFTGLNDFRINGKEIYKSDIIENCDTKELQVVYWNEEKAAWYCRYINNSDRIIPLCDSIGNLNKKIGNIHENSELLKQEDL